MKKTIAILLIAVMALTLFAACAGKKIIGTWELTGCKDDDELGEMIKGTTWEFKDDGTYTIVGLGTGKYEVKGNKLYINGDTSEYYKISFSGNTMKISGSEDSMTFTRK